MTPSPLFGVIVRWPRRLMASRRVSVSYDANGNLLTTGVMTNTWDSANRLIATLKQTATLVNHYDGLGNRVGRTQNGVRIDYALDVAIGLLDSDTHECTDEDPFPCIRAPSVSSS